MFGKNNVGYRLHSESCSQQYSKFWSAIIEDKLLATSAAEKCHKYLFVDCGMVGRVEVIGVTDVYSVSQVRQRQQQHQ